MRHPVEISLRLRRLTDSGTTLALICGKKSTEVHFSLLPANIEVHPCSYSWRTAAHIVPALVEGAALAAELGEPGDKYASIAPHVLCFLQRFWIPSGGYVDSNINANDGRTGKDANSILASIHTFDPSLGCDASTFQPCSDRALSNLKSVVDSMRWYNINNGIPAGTAVAVGRYSEDVYYDGNTWYLNTLAVAEQLYDALYVWQQEESITVTDTSLSFFRELASNAATGTFASDTSTYTSLFNAVSAYADGFVDVVATYVPDDGSMSEQYSKGNGAPLGASDLTWSYASFLTASSRRAGTVPPSWANHTSISVPGTCQRTSAVGSYSSATATSFPENQTPTDGVPEPTWTPPPCETPTVVDVTFEVRVRTQFGQNVKVVGDADELGGWNTNEGVSLSASQYTESDPVWKGTVGLGAGEAIEYKYIIVNQDTSIVWERDPNREYTVPRSCREAVSKSDTWRQ